MEPLETVAKVAVTVVGVAVFSCLLAFPLLYLVGNCLVFLPPLGIFVAGLVLGAILMGLGHPALAGLVVAAALILTVLVFRFWPKK